MLKRSVSILPFFFLSFVLAACAATPNVSVDYDQEYNFAPIKTYAFVEPEAKTPTSLYAQRVEREIENEMLFRAYRKVDAKDADILVSYFIVSKEKQDVRTYHHSHYYHYGRYRRYGCVGCGHTRISVIDYTEGTLVIDVVDKAAEKVVWRGVTKERLSAKESPDQRDAFVAERVRLMLENFPP